MTRCSAIVFLALSLLALEARADFDCSMIEASSGSASRNGSSLSLPLQIPNCEGVRVTSGTVVICAQDRRKRLVCRSFHEGETVTAGKLFPGPAGTGWTLAMLDLIRGGADERRAVSRGADQANAYLPQGAVLLLRDDFLIDFSHPALAGIQAVEFRQGSATGQILVSVPAIGVRTVSSSQFRRGETYWWNVVARRSGLPFSGAFSVLDAQHLRDTRAVEAALASTGGAQDRQARAVMLAEWLYTQDLPFDAAQTLLAAGFRLAEPAWHRGPETGATP